jgi:cation/acetate symporter
MLWRQFSTKGAVASMMVGTVTALVLIYFSPAIQIDILKHEVAFFPLKNPGLVTIPLSFAVGIVVSLLTPEAGSAERFAEAEHRISGDFQ